MPVTLFMERKIVGTLNQFLKVKRASFLTLGRVREETQKHPYNNDK
jgi:hypothetical protein